MRLLAFFALLVSTATADGVVGGYVLMDRSRDGQLMGMKELQTLADNAATLPLNRIWVSFIGPTTVYVNGSNTLVGTGLNVTSDADGGFAKVKAAIATLQGAGVEVFLSMGGWNYNCFPYLYARYSVGGYGTATPNYWKIEQFGQGSLDNCKEDNQFCYVCEPPSEGTNLGSYQVFPEPTHSATWQQAVKMVESTAGGATPKWSPDMQPSMKWTDPNTGISVTVPGDNKYATMGRDPYTDLVYLAVDLGAAGIDLDYEEFWHADFHKVGSGPWTLDQTVYKYAAIAQDMILSIKAIKPSLKMSTAAGAVGAWSGNWWGGNMKGVWLHVQQWFPDVMNFMSATNGINVMTYDLSNNEAFHECPAEGVCELEQQVQYYMNTYDEAGITANTGFEVGTPAYPDPTHDPTHQLPLTKAKLATIVSQSTKNGGFMWELFKPADGTDNASPTDVLQAICNKVTPGSPKCAGKIPDVM